MIILYDIETVKMVIFQPRMNNFSESEISVSELLDWAENVLKPTAQLAEKRDGEFAAGNVQNIACYWQNITLPFRKIYRMTKLRSF